MITNEKIYFDNAATTPLSEEVLHSMMPYLNSHYGNPSSIHSLGRTTRIAIEESRKKIASLLNVKPVTIVFTSGGTESNNTAIHTALRDLGCDHIITSKIEHHAVLHPIEHYADQFSVGISYVKLYEDGSVDQNDFRRLLQMKTAQGKKCLVSLMHANNEIGQLTEIRWISSLCKKHDAIFHSDCVQTIGHYPINLHTEAVHMASASAHKFHGPKGIGFLYAHEDLHISPLLYGGRQESTYRAGTENVAAIVGMAEALHLAYKNYAADQKHISSLNEYLSTCLKKHFPDCRFNTGRFSLYSLLSVAFRKNETSENLLLELDQKGICVSGGSACSGGGSHVMKELKKSDDYVTIRFSFNRHNTKEEINRTIEVMAAILGVEERLALN